MYMHDTFRSESWWVYHLIGFDFHEKGVGSETTQAPRNPTSRKRRTVWDDAVVIYWLTARESAVHCGLFCLGEKKHPTTIIQSPLSFSLYDSITALINSPWRTSLGDPLDSIGWAKPHAGHRCIESMQKC